MIRVLSVTVNAGKTPQCVVPGFEMETATTIDVLEALAEMPTIACKRESKQMQMQSQMLKFKVLLYKNIWQKKCTKVKTYRGSLPVLKICAKDLDCYRISNSTACQFAPRAAHRCWTTRSH